jgi:hypothetical protein
MLKREIVRWLYLLPIMGCILICGCTNEPKVDNTLLIGNWEIVKAIRNGKETKTLNGAFFNFNKGGKVMEYNLLGQTQKDSINISNLTISQLTGEKVEYKIVALSDTSLILRTNLRGTGFEFNLKRINE